MDNLDVLLARQRDRSIATILGVKERECDPYLPPEVSKQLRKVVLDQLNELTIFTSDLFKSAQDGAVVLNEIYMEKIDRLLDLVQAENGV